MPVCPKCAAQVPDGVKFCGSCGAPVDQPPSAPGAGAAPAGPGVPPAAAGSGGIAANVAAMLMYLPLCLIGLVCAILFGFILDPYKQNRFIRFHAWQSLAIHGGLLVLWIGWMIVSFVLTAIVHALVVLTFPISLLLALGVFILMIFVMIKAYGNQTFKLPVVGDWAEKQANG